MRIYLGLLLAGLIIILADAHGRSVHSTLSNDAQRKVVDSQYGMMVWDASCFGNIVKRETTVIMAPMFDDGSGPDISRRRVVGLVIEDFDESCGHIEIRRK